MSETKYKYDLTRVPRELLEAYAKEHLTVHATGQMVSGYAVGIKIIEAAKVPLRTRAEVDKDIAQAVRSYRKQWVDPLTYASRFEWNGMEVYLGEITNPLIDEETAD